MLRLLNSMKKSFITTIILAIVSMMVAGCSSCQSEKNKQGYDGDASGVIPEITASVENVIALNKQIMYNTVKAQEYIFFESELLMEKSLSDEDCDGKILAVNSVFQTNNKSTDGGIVCTVYMIETDGRGTQDPVVIPNAFFLEDCPLNEEPVIITYEQAFERVMEANIPKPDSRHVVLRKPLGPKPCNAQWIFGTVTEPIFVDAVTGAVLDSNPAF